jgi:hypothetical protein
MSDIDELRSIARWLLDNHIPISVSRLTAIADNVERQQREIAELRKNTQGAEQITHSPGCWSFGPKHYECACQRLTEYIEKDEGYPGIAHDLETAKRDLREAVELLRNITALMRGECPRLLNEDSGGDGRLSCDIDAFFARVKL